MNRIADHPEDFSPYLDRDAGDPRYETIRLHLEGCAACRDEIKTWQSVDELFRTGEAEIDVPPFQWQRIAAELRSEEAVPAGPRVLALFYPWRLAWNATLAALILVSMVFSGLEYRKRNEEKKLLSAITRYAEEEGRRIAADGNPFRLMAAANNNPFSRLPLKDQSRPFADRR